MATILDSEDIERSLRRIAHEIIERNRGAEDVMLLGIPTRGVTLAHRLRRHWPRSVPMFPLVP